MKEYRVFRLQSQAPAEPLSENESADLFKDKSPIIRRFLIKNYDKRIDRLAEKLGKSAGKTNNIQKNISVEYNTAAYKNFYETAAKFGFSASELYYYMTYTKKDLDKAAYFELKLGIYGKEDYTESYQTEYIYTYCENCDTKQFRPKREIYINMREFRGKDIAVSMKGNNEIIVSDKVKKLIEASTLTGVVFYPAYHYNKHLKNDYSVWRLDVTHVLPPMDSSVPFRIDDGYCNICKMHHILPLSYLKYSADALKNAADFNVSAEYFGNGWYGSPRLIISRRVYEMLKNNNIKGCRYEIIGIV